MVQSLSVRDLDRYGLKLATEAPADELITVNTKWGGPVTVPKGIDPGFAFNAGLSAPEWPAVRRPSR